MARPPHTYERPFRLWLSGGGGAIVGGLTGAAALAPVAVELHMAPMAGYILGAVLGFLGGLFTGLIAGDS